MAKSCLLGPSKERLQPFGQADFLTLPRNGRQQAGTDIALNDHLEFADPVERPAGDLGLGRIAQKLEVTARCAQQEARVNEGANHQVRRVSLPLTLVNVMLKIPLALAGCQDMLLLPSLRKTIGRLQVAHPPAHGRWSTHMAQIRPA